jgi:hypothetical protein
LTGAGTWEDVLEDSRIIRRRRCGISIGFGWSQAEPFSIEIVTAMLMSRGEEFFDDELNPTFVDENGEAIMDSAGAASTGS